MVIFYVFLTQMQPQFLAFNMFFPPFSRFFVQNYFLCSEMQSRVMWFYTENCSKIGFYAGWNYVGSLKIKLTHTKKHHKITGQL